MYLPEKELSLTPVAEAGLIRIAYILIIFGCNRNKKVTFNSGGSGAPPILQMILVPTARVAGNYGAAAVPLER
jgi:hypothetical protein